MIELCSKRKMLLAIVCLGLASVLIIILESKHLRAHEVDIHESHPILKEKMRAEDKCWQNQEYSVIEKCHTCTKEEIFSHQPVVCVANGYKEKVRCSTGNETYRACEKVEAIEERKFWIFETVVFFTGCASASMVFLRQKQLDHKMYQRIQRQIAAGV